MERVKAPQPIAGGDGDIAEATGGNDGERTTDRRRNPRYRTLKSGVIVSAGYSDIKCQILDLSDGGARLMPADPVHCPKRFVLQPLAGPARECEVIWRRGPMIGVRYV